MRNESFFEPSDIREGTEENLLLLSSHRYSLECSQPSELFSKENSRANQLLPILSKYKYNVYSESNDPQIRYIHLTN